MESERPELSAAARKLLGAARREVPSPAFKAHVLSRMLEARKRRSRSLFMFVPLAVPGLAGAVAVGLVLWQRAHSEREELAAIRAEPGVAAPSRAPSVATAEVAEPPREPARVLSPSPEPPAKPIARRSPAPKKPMSLSEEVQTLDAAGVKIKSGDAAGALRLLERYERSGASRLRAEATLLKIEALSRAGKAAEASRLAQAFVNEHADSPLVDRARVYVSGGPPTAVQKE